VGREDRRTSPPQSTGFKVVIDVRVNVRIGVGVRAEMGIKVQPQVVIGEFAPVDRSVKRKKTDGEAFRLPLILEP